MWISNRNRNRNSNSMDVFIKMENQYELIEVKWRWDILGVLLLIIFLFPSWIRETKYRKIDNSHKERLKEKK